MLPPSATKVIKAHGQELYFMADPVIGQISKEQISHFDSTQLNGIG